MSTRPRIGQGSPVEVYVPIAVTAGQPFPLKAVRFDSNVNVKIDIAAPPRKRFFLEIEGRSFDNNGKRISSDQSGNISTEIGTDGLPPGKYIVTVTGRSGGQEVAAEAPLEVLGPQTGTAS